MSTGNGTVEISEAERARRRKAVDRARHSTEMEGGQGVDEMYDAEEAYVRGEIDVDGLIEAARQLSR